MHAYKTYLSGGPSTPPLPVCLLLAWHSKSFPLHSLVLSRAPLSQIPLSLSLLNISIAHAVFYNTICKYIYVLYMHIHIYIYKQMYV